MICTILLNDLHDIVPQSMRYRGTIWAILSDLGFEFIFNFDETFRRKVALHDNHHKATDEQSVDSQGAEHRQTGVAQADECKQTRGDERKMITMVKINVTKSTNVKTILGIIKRTLENI